MSRANLVEDLRLARRSAAGEAGMLPAGWQTSINRACDAFFARRGIDCSQFSWRHRGCPRRGEPGRPTANVSVSVVPSAELAEPRRDVSLALPAPAAGPAAAAAPVLVPPTAELPDDVKALVRWLQLDGRSAAEISRDVGCPQAEVERILGSTAPAPTPARAPGARPVSLALPGPRRRGRPPGHGTQVREEARRLVQSGLSQRQIAQQLKVAQSTVHHWTKDLGVRQPRVLPKRKLTLELVRQIRAAVAGGTKQTAVAAEYGIDPATVCRIVRGDAWKESGVAA